MKKKKLTKGQRLHKGKVRIRGYHRWVDAVFPKPDTPTASKPVGGSGEGEHRRNTGTSPP